MLIMLVLSSKKKLLDVREAGTATEYGKEKNVDDIK